MRTGSSQDRVPYLSIGVFAQKIVDSLIKFIETDDSEALDANLPEALTSLKAATGEPRAAEVPRAMHALPSYEQLRTFNEVVATPEHRDEIIGVLEKLVQKRGSLKERRKGAEKAVRFFYALENRALRNFDQPTEPSPRGIRELCKQT